MNEFAKRTLMAALLVCSSAVPARAETAADVQTRIDGAMKSVKSFVVTTQNPPQAYSSTIVYVAPDRFRVAVAIAATTTDVITVGGTSYSSKNGASFEKAAVSSDESARMKLIGQVKVSATHADITVDGVTYGAFNAAAPPGMDAGLTCMYDKKNFRLVRCANGDWTQTFNKYDDPGNVVDAPAGAK